MTTSSPTRPTDAGLPAPTPSARTWLALLAMTSMSFVLVSAEFLPGGLLTSMASDLGVSPGAAGQAVTVTAVAGFVAALSVSALTPGIDRRTLLVGLSALAAVSNLAVALAPSLWLLLLSRVLLGAALSGFWSMSLTVAATIIGRERVGRGMMMVNAGTTLATVIGVPAGVLISSLWDWRTVFVLMAGLTLVVGVGLRALLPSVPAARGVGLRSLTQTIRLRGMPQGLAGHVLVVLGQMVAYAFIRVALERVPGADTGTVAILLLVFGIGGFVGNFVIGAVADRLLPVLRYATPATIGVAVIALSLWPNPSVAIVATAAWGFAFGGWLVVLNTWLARQVPDQLEAGGGLAVAGFQLAIAGGAGLGGLLVDGPGIATALLTAGVIALLGAALFGSAPARAASGEVLATPPCRGRDQVARADQAGVAACIS